MNITIHGDRTRAVIDTLGAQLTSFQKNGKEYIWNGDEAYWKGRAPLLFPFVGGLRGGKTLIDGKFYEMPRHGFIRFREFAVLSRSENAVTLRYTPDKATKEVYPFDFAFDASYVIENDVLTSKITVTNTDARPLPYTVGFHTGYCIDPEDFDHCRLTLEKPETVSYPAAVVESGLLDFTRMTPFLNNEDSFTLNHHFFDVDAIVMTNLNSRSVMFENPKGDRRFKIEFPDFEHLVFWSTAKRAPFLCIEPVTGCCTTTEENDVFEEKRDMTLLAPNDSRSYTCRLTVL